MENTHYYVYDHMQSGYGVESNEHFSIFMDTLIFH